MSGKRTLSVFSGKDSRFATTPDPDGADLPPELAPWKNGSSFSDDDTCRERGMDKGTRKAIEARGYSLRRIAVTFEPSTTAPEERDGETD